MNSALYTVRRHAALGLAALITADRGITMAHWHYESNPIVNGMGMANWIGLTVACLAVMLYLWYGTEVSESRMARACVYSLSVLMATVVVTNGLYVTGLWPF